jgi:hypothetical protein
MFAPGVISPVDGRLSYFGLSIGSSSPSSSSSSASVSPSLGPSQPLLSPCEHDSLLESDERDSHDSARSLASLTSVLDCSSPCFPLLAGHSNHFPSFLTLLNFLKPLRNSSSRTPLIVSPSSSPRLVSSFSRLRFLALPSDVIEFLLPPFLDATSLIQLSLTCCSLRSIENDQALWRSLVHALFPYDSASYSRSSSLWKSIYQHLHQIHWDFVHSPQLANKVRIPDFGMKLCLIGIGETHKKILNAGNLLGQNGEKSSKFHSSKIHAQLGMEVAVKRVFLNKKLISLKLIAADLPGHSDSLLDSSVQLSLGVFLRKMDGLIFCFHVNSRKSFQTIVKFRQSLDALANRSFPAVLIGEINNKTQEQQINKEEIKQFSQFYQMDYIPVDFTSGEGVEQAIYRISCICLHSILPDIPVNSPQLFEAFAASRGGIALLPTEGEEPPIERMEMERELLDIQLHHEREETRSPSPLRESSSPACTIM